MTDEDRLAAAAAANIDWERPVIIETTMLHVVGVIGMLQVALRHPEAAQRSTGKMTREFVVKLIEQIDPEHGELWTLLNRGFNSKWDI